MPPCQFLAGIDASDFDWGRGPVNIGAAVRDGITFFTHKATEGTTIQHIHYGDALNRANAAGMPFMGAYLVVRTPGNNGHGSIQAQVNFFLAYLDGQTPWWRTRSEFFIQVDTEHWGYDDVAPQYGVLACDLLRTQTGKLVMHYAPRWAYGDTIGGNHPLWASSYGTNPTVPYRNAYPGDGSSGWAPYSGRTPTILQYGSRLTIGSQPICDGNAFRGTIDQLRELITGKKTMMALIDDGDFNWLSNRLEGIAHMRNAIAGGLGKGDPIELVQVIKRIDQNAATAVAQAVTGPTQAQVDAAILKAMLDPAVQKGIGDAIATHLHVT
jgi:hypothetical protein